MTEVWAQSAQPTRGGSVGHQGLRYLLQKLINIFGYQNRENIPARKVLCSGNMRRTYGIPISSEWISWD
jgi:hypothetical protein